MVKSESYQSAMKAKGAHTEQWNWQAQERKNGIIPNLDESEANDNFEMESELL